ncbi:MAG: hypothetical protein IJT81_04870 [Lachnospiraceae bacterium]|nr:hypothetical protein [Lachnospiraceae bacterium]
MIYDLPAIEGIDWEKAHSYLPDKDMLIKVLEETVRTCVKHTQLLTVLKSTVLTEPSDESFAAFRIQAHAMKATLRTLGSELFEKAFSLEMAGKDGDIDKIRDDTDSFIEDYKRFSESLKAVVGDCDKGKAYDREEFIKQITILKSAMETFDVGTLQEAFDEALRMDLPEEYKDVITKLEKAVRELDSDEVISCCNELL